MRAAGPPRGAVALMATALANGELECKGLISQTKPCANPANGQPGSEEFARDYHVDTVCNCV